MITAIGSDLTTKVVKRIEELSPEEWAKTFPDVLENYYFFKTLDESHFDQFSFYYILVYDQDDVVGATSCFLMNYPLDTTVRGPLKALMSTIKKTFPNFLNLKVLICGLPMGPGRIGIIGKADQVMETILKCLEQIAQDEKVSIIAFKDFDAHYTNALDRLQEKEFWRFESMPNTEMEIKFKNFDEYLKTLSRVSRDGVKRKFKKVDGQVKIDLEISNELNGSLEEAHALYLQTSAKNDVNFEILPKEFFENISKNMPNQTKYFLWRINNKLVAFALCLVSGDHFIDYYLGFDYSVAYDYHLYFVRFRDLMNWCIQNKIKKYEMGTTSYEPKKRLGFNFIPLYVYAKHRRKWINSLLKLLSRFLKPENFDQTLKELKKKNDEE